MLKGVENGITRTVTLLVSSLLTVSCLFGAIYFLVGMNSTGADVAVGEVMGKAAQDAGDFAMPAMKNMGGPAWEIGKTAVGDAVAGLKPSGEAVWGSVTINWDEMFSGDGGNVTINGESYDGGNAGSANNDAPAETQTPVATQCQDSTPQSRAALTAWMDGDWETAVAQFSLTNLRNDCLAAKLAEVFQPFDAAMQKLYGAENAQQFADAVKRIKAMNPQFTEVYAAEAMGKVQGIFGQTPFAVNASLFPGSTISVTAVSYEAWAAEKTEGSILKNDKDIFDLTVSFQSPWESAFRLNRMGMEQLEEAFGLDEGYFNAAGDTYTVPGSYIPSDLGQPLLPSGVEYDSLSGYQGSSSESAPAAEAPAPAAEQNAAPAATATAAPVSEAPVAGTKVCTWPGIGGSGGQYMVAYLGVDQATIESLNPGLWAQYASAPGTARDVIVPSSASCK